MASSETVSTNCSSSDNSLVIDLVVPGRAEPYKLTLSDTDTIMDLKQIVIQSLEPSLRTCFSLTHDGKSPLDEFSAVTSIANIKDGDSLRVLDEPYNLREAIFHITRLKETLNFGNKVAHTNKACGLPISVVDNLSTSREFDEIKNEIISNINAKSCNLQEFVVHAENDEKCVKCLKSLELSPFNPPVPHRKLLGDLLYLNVQTLEGKDLFITCGYNGFFINKSTNMEFDPTPQNDSHKAYTLSNLLLIASHQYKVNLHLLIKAIERGELIDFVVDYKLTNNWLSKPQLPEGNLFKSYEAVFNVVGIEDIINGQIRDWNEELQTVRTLDVTDPGKRVVRDRALYRVLVEKALAARRGAIAIIEGSVKSINTTEPFRSKLFLWNNLFYSISCDVKGFFKEVGGDDATHSAAGLDHNTVEYLLKLGYDKISFIGSTIIDYQGYRIIAQTIAPGIFHRDQAEIIEHGMMMDNRSVKCDDRFSPLTSKLAEDARIRATKVIDRDGAEKVFHTSVEVKGICGTDGRLYLVDLYRMLPSDALFVDEEMSKSKHFSKDFVFSYNIAADKFGYEFSCKRFKNKMRVFRRELVDEFYLYRENKFNNDVRTLYDKRRKEENINSEEALNTLITTIKQELDMKYSCSLDLTYNYYVSPDCFIGYMLDLPEEEKKNMEKDRAFCHMMSVYLVETHIPLVIRKTSEEYIIDGESLKDYLHSMGINMRYLGYIRKLASAEKLYHVERVVVSEMIVRVAKKILKKYLVQSKLSKSTVYLVSHFLNCLLGAHDPPKTYNYQESLLTKKRKKKNSEVSAEWKSMTCKGLWEYINSEVVDFYNFDLDCKTMSEVFSKHSITPLSLLRRFSSVMGLQLMLRNYDFTNTKHCTFSPEDILNVLPVVRIMNVVSADVEAIFACAKNLMNYSYVEALRNLQITMSYINQIYGVNHPMLAECCHLMASCYYNCDKIKLAVENQKRATAINECYYGLDHYKTVKSYLYLGLFCYYDKDYVVALQLLNRVIYLVKLIYGVDYPELSNYYINQAVILSSIGNNELSTVVLEQALTVADKQQSEEKVAFIKFLIAKQHVTLRNFKIAISSAKDALKLFEKLHGANSKFVLETKQMLTRITQMAVANEQMINKKSKMDVLKNHPDIRLGDQDFRSTLNQLATRKAVQSANGHGVLGDIALD